MTTHIRIRATSDSGWRWELLTADGHVANVTDPFDSRDACEADAKLQGLPITGLKRVRKTTSL